MFVKHVLYAVLAAAIFAIGIGYLAPSLISSDNDLGVVLGFLAIPGTVILEYLTIKSWLNMLVENEEKA